MLSERARKLCSEIKWANIDDNATLDSAEERFQSSQAGALTAEPSDLRFERTPKKQPANPLPHDVSSHA